MTHFELSFRFIQAYLKIKAYRNGNLAVIRANIQGIVFYKTLKQRKAVLAKRKAFCRKAKDDTEVFFGIKNSAELTPEPFGYQGALGGKADEVCSAVVFCILEYRGAVGKAVEKFQVLHIVAGRGIDFLKKYLSHFIYPP